MKRLGYLTGTWPRRSETFIAQEVAALVACPEVSTVPLAIWRGADGSDPAMTYLTLSGKAGGGGARGASRLRLPSELHRQWSLYRHRAALHELVRAIRAHEISHLHAAFGDLPALLAATAAAITGITCSVSVHADDAASAKYPDATIFAPATGIFACNQRISDVLVARYPAAAGRVRLVHHGLHLADWPLRGTVPPGPPWRLLVVGRLVPKKGIARALDLLRALRASGVDATLEVIGDGPLREPLARHAAGLPVSWRGEQPRAAVLSAMHGAHLLLATSDAARHSFEGIPNVIIEAMASGVPVAAVLTGGIGEVLTPATGWAVPADPVPAATIVAALLADPAAQAARTAAARALIAADFSFSACFTSKLAFFRSQLGG